MNLVKYYWKKEIDLRLDKYVKIDAHAHIQDLNYPFNVKITTEEFVYLMELYNIEKAIISDVNNENISNAIKRYPEKLLGIVWANPKTENTLDVVRHYIEEHKFKGIKLHPLLHMFTPNSKEVHKILNLAQEFGVPVFIHSGHPPTSLPWQIENLAKHFPDVPIVMVHMGHGNAFYIQAAIEIAERCENIYLETSGMPMSAKIAEAYDIVPEKVLFGTDIPCHHPAVEILKVLASNLPETALKKIFYENAKKLMKL